MIRKAWETCEQLSWTVPYMTVAILCSCVGFLTADHLTLSEFSWTSRLDDQSVIGAKVLEAMVRTTNPAGNLATQQAHLQYAQTVLERVQARPLVTPTGEPPETPFNVLPPRTTPAEQTQPEHRRTPAPITIKKSLASPDLWASGKEALRGFLE